MVVDKRANLIVAYRKLVLSDSTLDKREQGPFHVKDVYNLTSFDIDDDNRENVQSNIPTDVTPTSVDSTVDAAVYPTDATVMSTGRYGTKRSRESTSRGGESDVSLNHRYPLRARVNGRVTASCKAGNQFASSNNTLTSNTGTSNSSSAISI